MPSKEYSKQWRAKNIDKRRAAEARYRETHKDAIRAAQLKYSTKKYAKQREQIVEARRAFRDAAPLTYHLTNARSRARKAGQAFELTIDNIVVPAACPACGRGF